MFCNCGKLGLMINRSRFSITCSSANGSPHHQVPTEGIFKGSSSRRWHRAGKNPSKAPDDSRLEPRLLAIKTLPRRAASIKPATPSTESVRSSSGSQKSSSTRRRMTCTRCRPDNVLYQTMPLRTVRSLPSTSGKPRYLARKVCS